MQAVSELKSLLFEEFEHIVKSSANLIRKVSPEHWDYKPQGNMRSMLEIVHHLVSIPSVDLLIMQEKTETEIRKAEAAIAADGSDKEKLIAWMTQGTEQLKLYMNGLSDDDFLHKKTMPFYMPNGSVQAKWLIESTTHVQHHRAQLFGYLKQLGYGVNMFDLY
jgi:uncharacterized damage-inducible protein DinB